jgi:tryptophan synthase beta chain
MVSLETIEAGAPDHSGRFGEFGGRFVPESLMPAVLELEVAFREAWADPGFRAQFHAQLVRYGGRPTPLYLAERLSELVGAEVWLKREDLAHTGSHKLNNVVGQAMLAVRMGKTALIAETGAGQHGVATATAAALYGLSATIYMGEIDVARQALNVARMELLGARVVPVTSGSRTLKDSVNEAMRVWVSELGDTHYCIGSVMGPHPYPWMVREFQRVIGDEARAQFLEARGGTPDWVVACVGGGSNAAGTFTGFVDTPARLVGVEPEGGAAVGHGTKGFVHGMHSYFLQDEAGQVEEASSISAGLDYPGVGPEHAWWAATGRARYEQVSDEEVLEAVGVLARLEGIVAALEPAHAIAWLLRERARVAGQRVLVTLSGRGDKDMETIAAHLKARQA